MALSDHLPVRRTHDDPSRQVDSKPTKQPASQPGAKSREDAPDGRALVEALQQTAGNAAVGALLADQRSRVPSIDQGQAVPLEFRQSAEHTLGADLTDVRVHSDAAAGEYARSLKAEAVTVNRDVFLASGVDPATTPGRKTLLHELVHAAQVSSTSQDTDVSSSRVAAEREARAISSVGFSGVAARPQVSASSTVPHLKTADDEQEVDAEQPPQPAVTAEELLNPPESKTDESPEPGTSGENEGVVYEIAIMQPLRSIEQALGEQDWEKADAIIRSIGMKLMNYQNNYEKTDPMLYRTLMEARGWLSVVLQQIERRLDKGVWSDENILSTFKDVRGDFELIEGMLH